MIGSLIVPVSVPDRPFHVAFGVPLRDGVPLVVKQLSLDEREFHLGPPPLLEVHGEGNEGETFFPDLREEAQDLDRKSVV